MKNTIHIISTIIILCLQSSCTTKNDHTTYLTVLADRTDINIQIPEIDAIKKVFDLKINPNQKAEFRFQNIGNTDFNTTYHLGLPSYSVLSNSLQRLSNIRKFYTTIDTLVQKQNRREYNYQSSSIFTPLNKHLKLLSKVTADKKVLLLYSDLTEYSDIFNCYSTSNQQLLFKNNELVYRRFREKRSVSDLHDVELYIIYYPKTNAENRLFQSLCTLYQEIFKDTGLKIHIGLDTSLKLTR